MRIKSVHGMLGAASFTGGYSHMKHTTVTTTIGLTCSSTLQQQIHRARLFWHTLTPGEQAQCEAMEAEVLRRQALAVTTTDVAPQEAAGSAMMSD